MIKQINLMWTSNAPDQLVMALNPLRPFRMWRNNITLKNILTPHIESEVQKQLDGTPSEYKTIISLASKAYLAETPSASKTKIDEEFMDLVVNQIKIFLLAGHDTTASGISYAYYLLHKNPHVLAKMREEHDSVLGTDTSTARAQIAADPTLLNKLSYTAAFMKEALRLTHLSAVSEQVSQAISSRIPIQAKNIQQMGLCCSQFPLRCSGIRSIGLGLRRWFLNDGSRRKERSCMLRRIRGGRLSWGQGIVLGRSSRRLS